MLHYSSEYISYLVNTFILYESVSRMLSYSGLLKRNLHISRFMNAGCIASIHFGTPWIWPVTFIFQSICPNEDTQAPQAPNGPLWGSNVGLDVFLKAHFLSSSIPVVHLVDNCFADWNTTACKVLELKWFKLRQYEPLSRVHRSLCTQHRVFFFFCDPQLFNLLNHQLLASCCKRSPCMSFISVST
jgi:hypothetical protein